MTQPQQDKYIKVFKKIYILFLKKKKNKKGTK